MMSILNNTIAHQNEIILIALCIRAGIAPFHFWFPQVIKIAEWAQCTLILTWQKVAPFILISYLTRSKITYAVILISALVGRTGGLNQIALKLVLTYSSIAHSAWILALCSSSSLSSWITYFLIYCSISISVIVVLYKTNVTILQQILVNKWRTSIKSTFILRIISLGGLPPLLGFIAKLNAIQLIFNPLGFALIRTLIISSLLSLFYYTRLIYSALLKIRQTTAVSPIITCRVPPSVIVISTAGNVIAPLFILLT
jgi:NADH-ubiquinone oxidoreductase chain 2